jgi:hypothetical protein
MTRLSGDFQTDLTLPSALGACADAVHSLGWKINSLGGDRIVSTAVSDQTGSEVTVELELTKTPQGTDIRIVGTDSGADPLREPELADLLDQLGDAVEARIEETDAEEAAQEPQSEATETTAAATAVTQVQEPDKSDWVPVDDKGDWLQVDDEPAADQAPAGWFPDPMADDGERYWDGEEWTHRVRTGRAEPPPKDESKPTSSWWHQNRRAVLIGAFVFLLGGAIGAAATDGGKTTTRTATKTARANVHTTTQTTTVTKIQTPQTATATTNPVPPTSTTGAVGPTTTPDASTGCDPSYANVCLDPKASDYDCKGGGGDGPKFVSGPVVIVGSDHFGLDGSDHDGIGCE